MNRVEWVTWAIILSLIITVLVKVISEGLPAPAVPQYEELSFLQDSTLQARAIEVAQKQLEYYILLEEYLELCQELTGQSAQSCLSLLWSSASSSSLSSQEL